MQRSKYAYKEISPPNLGLIIKINHPENELIFEHWRYLVSSTQIINNNQRNIYIIYKSKCSINFINFYDGCLLYQKSFKVLYAQVQEITCLKILTMNIKQSNGGRSKQLIILIGFFDGIIEIYNLIAQEKAITFKKLLSFENNERKQPITSFGIIKNHLFVCKLHSVSCYKQCLSILANRLIDEAENTTETLLRKNKQQISCIVENLRLGNLSQGSTLNMNCMFNSVYVFNQTDGSKFYNGMTLEQTGSIIDSIETLKEFKDDILALGDANDKLKIIYKQKNIIDRYSGFKNYCSVIEYLNYQDDEEIWIGDMSGRITYLVRNIKNNQIKNEKSVQLKMHDLQVSHSVKLIDSGIKEMRVLRQNLVILDTQSNIFIFDIIRNQNKSTTRQQVDTVEDYESSTN